MSVVPQLWSEMDSDENLSLDNSLLYGDSNDLSIISSADAPESLSTFQMFREKKIKVEEEMKYTYRVMLGGDKQPIPWLAINKSHIEDWEIQFQNDYAEVSRNDEDITDLFIKCADERISILLGEFTKMLVIYSALPTVSEGVLGTGKSSFLKQIALDWGRGAAYLQHFNLVLLLDCSTFVGQDFDKQITKAYKIMKQEKMNLQKWEVQNEPFLLLLDCFDKLHGENIDTISRIISGETFSKCSILAASREGKSTQRSLFNILVKLKGWKEETVVEVIHKQFPHSPNKVLALKLKLSNNDPFKFLVRCPLLAQLACLAYEDTGDLAATSSETLHSIMRCVFKRELFKTGRTLHDQNYDSSLIILGQKCLYNLSRGRNFLRTDDVAGFARRYCTTIMGFLLPTQITRVSREKKDHYEPLHRSFMEFTAGFYLKSLSDKNQLQHLSKEIEDLFDNNCESLEHILNYALEMLAPLNACSDILTRIPKQGMKVISKEIIKEVGGQQYTVTDGGDIWKNLDQPGRMRLLQTSGYSTANVGAILYGLVDDTPKIHCSAAEINGWTRILEFRCETFSSLDLKWSTNCSSLSELNIDKLFKAANKTQIRKINIELDFSQPHVNTSLDSSEQLHYTGLLLDHISQSVAVLSVRIKGSVVLFPLIEALSKMVKKADHLKSLCLDMELSTSNLSMMTSSLLKCDNLDTLILPKVTSGSCGFKQLQNLMKAGKLFTLEIKMNSSFFGYKLDESEVNNEYVYEDETIISEEVKMKKLTPLLGKVIRLASLPEKEVAPAEVVEGSLHPSLRFGNIYPLPICSSSKSGFHYISQSLCNKHTSLANLTATITEPQDLLCLGDGLMSNTSLRTLKISGSLPSDEKHVVWSFPLMLGISTHLGLVEVDLSGLSGILDSEALELVLAGFSSNTALSLNKVSLSGWVFDCNITEKTGIKQVFKNSRISCLDLSYCQVKLGCNQRQFTLYFEMDDPFKSRSLWHEIHDEKVVSTTVPH